MRSDKSAGRRTRVLVIGVGNAYRRDDAVGLVVARRLVEETGRSLTVREESGEGADLMDAWQDAEVVILLDAVSSGAAPGTIGRFDVRVQPLPTPFFRSSTHTAGVAEAIELARALGALPPRLIVYGVEGADFTAGEGLSPDVEKAVQAVVRLVLDDASPFL
jgi:hydrogenase maturation protease